MARSRGDLCLGLWPLLRRRSAKAPAPAPISRGCVTSIRRRRRPVPTRRRSSARPATANARRGGPTPAAFRRARACSCSGRRPLARRRAWTAWPACANCGPASRCARTSTGCAAPRRRARAQGRGADRAGAPRKGLPMVVVHGLDDGLIPPAFSSAPYVAMARKAGAQVSYWQIRNVQHFDAFLGLPALGARYLPLLPYVYAALDRVDAHLAGGAALPGDAVVETVPRAQGQGMKADNLAVPK
ncbi:hypothetical protein FE772_14285 [Lysobacter enzymogenes]|nr:hypothetical protein FE772_14285 [Lysobacter enzymogenes]